MSVLRTAMICTLATIACQAALAGDLPQWKPGRAAIAKLDFAFRNAGQWHGAPPDLGKYARYYAGVTIHGRRMLRAEFTDVSYVENGDAVSGTPRDIHVLPEARFPVIFDGGCSVVNMLFDVAAGRMVWLRCNGLA